VKASVVRIGGADVGGPTKPCEGSSILSWKSLR
jgi:hypothetical protein